MRTIKSPVYFLIFLAIFQLDCRAEVFQYKDSTGRSYYVDDIKKVPDKYLNSVKKDSETPKISKYNSYGGQSEISVPRRGDSGSGPRTQTKAKHQKKVEIFVTSWCPACKALEKFLKAERIPFTRYDVEHDSYGIRAYQSMGGGGIPLIRIGSTVLRGFSETEVLSALSR